MTNAAASIAAIRAESEISARIVGALECMPLESATIADLVAGLRSTNLTVRAAVADLCTEGLCALEGELVMLLSAD